MTLERFYDDRGPLQVGDRIGRGGEGEVYALADGTERALKIYFERDAGREAKVRSMVAAGLSASCPDVTFPLGPAFAPDGSFAGFTMPLITGCHPIHELHSPSSRRRLYPNVDWRFLVRAGANLSRVFARVHATGAVVGDVNAQGVLVSHRAIATLIDADSFAWGPDHPCRVGVVEYTPPELQGRGLAGVVRTAEHDLFGLAVLLFQLLHLGRHPMAGVPIGRDVPLKDMIRRHAFAYSLIRDVGSSPPPGSLLLTDLPPGVRVLFERAFASGLGPRPAADRWATVLHELERNLRSCDRNGRHHRSKEILECPWCRIETLTGKSMFGTMPPIDNMVRRRSPSWKTTRLVEDALRRAASVSNDGAVPRYGGIVGGPSEGARAFLKNGGAPLGLLQAKLVAARGRPLNDRFTRCAEQARTSLVRALEAWRERTGVWRVNRLAALLADDLDRFHRSGEDEARDTALSLARLRRTIVRDWLSSSPISAAAVPHVGAGRLAALSDAGIMTAADITKRGLSLLKCLGSQATASLLLWRDTRAVECLSGISDLALPVHLEEEVRSDFALRAVEAEAALREAGRTLIRAIDALDRRVDSPDPDVDSARRALAVAEADLELLGLPLPVAAVVARQRIPRAATTSSTRSKAAKAKGRGCPICGAALVKRRTGGQSPGRSFLGCSGWPKCSGSRPMRQPKP